MNIKLAPSFVLASFSILLGLLSIFGWIFHIEVFYTLLSHGASMKFNAAFATMLLGISIVLASRNKTILSGLLGLVILDFILPLLFYNHPWLGASLAKKVLLVADHQFNRITDCLYIICWCFI
jgi:hypothetical protein